MMTVRKVLLLLTGSLVQIIKFRTQGTLCIHASDTRCPNWGLSGDSPRRPCADSSGACPAVVRRRSSMWGPYTLSNERRNQYEFTSDQFHPLNEWAMANVMAQNNCYLIKYHAPIHFAGFGFASSPLDFTTSGCIVRQQRKETSLSWNLI